MHHNFKHPQVSRKFNKAWMLQLLGAYAEQCIYLFHLSLFSLEQGSRVQHSCFFYMQTYVVFYCWVLIETGSLWFAALHGSAACEVQLCSEIQVIAVTEGVTSFDAGDRIRSGQVSLPSPHYVHRVMYVTSRMKMWTVSLLRSCLWVPCILSQHTTKVQFITEPYITCLSSWSLPDDAVIFLLCVLYSLPGCHCQPSSGGSEKLQETKCLL